MSQEDALTPFLVSNDAQEDGAELRSRMERDGYLFFKGLISQERLRAARHEILECCQQGGWLDTTQGVSAGVAASGVAYIEPEPAYMAVYNEIIKGQAFHSLALDPSLMQTLSTLFGEPALAHSRNIARIIFPNATRYTTPSHQDYIHIQGTMETYTAWIPLSDCPKALGSLVVLKGSHRDGVLPVHSAYGAGGLGIRTDNLPYEWTGSDYEAGDVVIFHSLTVHKALPNLSPDHIRLSCDFRYQPLSHPIDPSSLLPHHNQLTWEQVYADWKTTENQYYWRDLPIRTTGHDPAVIAVRNAAVGTNKEDFAE